MTATTFELPRKFPWPTLLSIAIHGSIIAGVLFISARQTIPLSAPSQPISVTMVAPADLEPAQPVVAAPPPEPVVEPEPEPEPEPVMQPKAAVVIQKPKPKPKPKLVHKQPMPERRDAPAQPRQDNLREDVLRSVATPTQPAPGPASATPAAPGGPLAVSRNQPQYPSRAYALRIEGNVRVRFDVTNEGRVDNITILSANPQNMFEREVKQAMKRWRYQSGRPGAGLVVNVIFKINGGAQVQ